MNKSEPALRRRFRCEATARLRPMAYERAGYDWDGSRTGTPVARKAQLPPAGDWRIWLILAGRGFGKTRAGAEWVRAIAERRQARRIALAGPTAAAAREVMIEGESGILSISPPDFRPAFEPILLNNYVFVPYGVAFGLDIPMLEIPPGMWGLLTVGIGGYVASRGAEKIVQNWPGKGGPADQKAAPQAMRPAQP